MSTLQTAENAAKTSLDALRMAHDALDLAWSNVSKLQYAFSEAKRVHLRAMLDTLTADELEDVAHKGHRINHGMPRDIHLAPIKRKKGKAKT